MSIGVCLIGEGAQGEVYANALRGLPGVELVSLAGGNDAATTAFAQRHRIPFCSLEIKRAIAAPGVKAVIVGSPSALHATHAELAMRAGKHVLLEIPMALNLADAERLATLEGETQLTCMVAHTRRYQDIFQEVVRRVRNGELDLHHVVSQTYFFRRTNLNRDGNPRTWVDSLLWHHGCHLIDSIYALLRDPDMEIWAQSGPDHPDLRIPMDISVGMRSRGVLVTAVLSFNHHGTIQVNTRYIGEQATLMMVSNEQKLYDDQGNTLVTGSAEQSFIAQCTEFFDAIHNDRPALTSFAECLPVMRLIDRAERSMERHRVGVDLGAG